MNTLINAYMETPIYHFFDRFSPATKAALWFAAPLIILDTIQYASAGTSLVYSLPFIMLLYFLCGRQAAKISFRQEMNTKKLTRVGASACERLWLLSTFANTLLALLLGGASLGWTILGGTAYLCLFGPVHAILAGISGWTGAWFYRKFTLKS